MKWFFCALIRGYQLFLSPILSLLFNIHCRFEESCSRYTARMIREKGSLKGLYLGLLRFIKCNPFSN